MGAAVVKGGEIDCVLVEMPKLQENLKRRFAEVDQLITSHVRSDKYERPTTVSVHCCIVCGKNMF